MHNHHTGIVILAAGASERMGTPKQLLKIDGRTLIQRVAQTALDSGCRPVVAVLGANASAILPELDEMEVLPIINADWQSGMSTSIRTGLLALLKVAPLTEGVLLMVADQPAVTATSLWGILEVQAQTEAGLVAARFNEVIGTPAFFSLAYFSDLLRLEGAGGAKGLLQHYHERVLSVDLPEAELDLDTPMDIAAYNQLYDSALNIPGLSPAPRFHRPPLI